MKQGVSLAVVLLLAACQTATYTDKLKISDLTPGSESAPIQVLGNAGEWRNTGIPLHAGQRYRVKADGRWRAHPLCNDTGPSGAGMYVGLCIPWDVGKIIPERPHQALLGRIGQDGPIFPIGDFTEFQAQRDGLLYLHMNETDFGVGDNTGEVTATVMLMAPPAIATAPAPTRGRETTTSTGGQRLPSKPLEVTFPAAAPRPDDVAVIIGNGDYSKLGRDIPDVVPAHADAESAKRYAQQALGIREGNIIDLRDATGAQFVRVFGSATNPRGQLYDWVRPGRSRVFVYYAGHGAPGSNGAYLVPSDADAARIELNGYPLETLYRNLGHLPAERVTVVLEACFSGTSQAGSVVTSASPIYARIEPPKPPRHVTVVAAGAANQIASWEQDKSHGLFTKFYFTGMAGAADKAPYGNGDGIVAFDELGRYLKETLTYYARRYYGRDQNAQIEVGR